MVILRRSSRAAIQRLRTCSGRVEPLTVTIGAGAVRPIAFRPVEDRFFLCDMETSEEARGGGPRVRSTLAGLAA